MSEKAQNYFMFIVSSEDVNSTVHQWRSLPTWNPMAQVMGLFTEIFDSETIEEQIRNVLGELLLHNMLNVNLMYNRAGTNMVEMITWFPYENINCADRILNLRIVDQCEYVFDSLNSSDTNIVFRPKKKEKKIPTALHGCPLKVSSSIWVSKNIVTISFFFTNKSVFYRSRTPIMTWRVENSRRVLKSYYCKPFQRYHQLNLVPFLFINFIQRYYVCRRCIIC